MLRPSTSLAAASDPQLVADHLSFPSNMAFAPDGRLFFAEKDTGDIRVIEDGRPAARAVRAHRRPVRGRAGTLGTRAGSGVRHRSVGLRLLLGPGRAHQPAGAPARGRRPAGPQPLLDALTTENGYHNGGDIVFGRDGKLYVSVGEVHESQRAQDPNDLGGKILRLNPDGTDAVGRPVRRGEPRVLDGPSQLLRAVRRPLERRSVGDGERSGQRRRGQPDPAGRELRLAGPARSGRRAAVHRPGARFPERHRADGVRGVAGRSVLRRRSEPVCSTGCRCRRTARPRADVVRAHERRRHRPGGGPRRRPVRRDVRCDLAVRGNAPGDAAPIAPAGRLGRRREDGRSPIVAGIVLAAGLAAAVHRRVAGCGADLADD